MQHNEGLHSIGGLYTILQAGMWFSYLRSYEVQRTKESKMTLTYHKDNENLAGGI